jgi:hypothetical protein
MPQHSNLPPGVSERMIPGNQPEDEAEDAFWEKLDEQYARTCPNFHLIVMWVMREAPASMVEIEVAFEGYIRLARDIGYNQGFDEGKAHEQMSRMEEPESSDS